jgi:hypothetical protein
MATPMHLKPALARWIVTERKRLGLKPKDVADRLHAMGLDVSEATVKVWESNADRRPAPYNVEGLERIFGSSAPTRVDTADRDVLAAAIDRQTAMLEAVLTRLGDLLAEARRQGAEEREAILDAVADVRAALPAEGIEGGAEPRSRTLSGQ